MCLKAQINMMTYLKFLLRVLELSNVEYLTESCFLLPSIKESCFSSEEQEEVDTTLKFYFNSSYERTLLLCQYLSAIKYNGEMYGSLNSFAGKGALLRQARAPHERQRRIIATAELLHFLFHALLFSFMLSRPVIQIWHPASNVHFPQTRTLYSLLFPS